MRYRWLALIILTSLLLAACTPQVQAPAPTAPPTPSARPDLTPTSPPVIGPTSSPWTSVYDGSSLEMQATRENRQIYTDPGGQFRFLLPSGWQPEGDAEGLFSGPDGLLRVGFLPELGYIAQLLHACEWLANPPGNPALDLDLDIGSGWGNHLDKCTVRPFPEMNVDLARLVIPNPRGEPEQRFIYLETDQAHLGKIGFSLQLLHPPGEREWFPYPNGPLRPDDESFWAQTAPLPAEMTVEEYAVVEAAVDGPANYEFYKRIPDEVLQKRAAWRGGYAESRLARNNALLEPFGYSIAPKEGSETRLFGLYRGKELLLDDINEVRPVSVSASGSDFALAVCLFNGGCRLVQKDRLEYWDRGDEMFLSPIFYGEKLLHLQWDPSRGQVHVLDGEESIFTFSSTWIVNSPVERFRSWENHWILEIDGFLIQDGENLNARLGYEEIFGWQELNGKPFYYFRKGPRVGISYGGQTLPLYYDEIVHYLCCGYATYNPSGNEDMVWFYGLREGMWYYVEIGAYDEKESEGH